MPPKQDTATQSMSKQASTVRCGFQANAHANLIAANLSAVTVTAAIHIIILAHNDAA